MTSTSRFFLKITLCMHLTSTACSKYMSLKYLCINITAATFSAIQLFTKNGESHASKFSTIDSCTIS